MNVAILAHGNFPERAKTAIGILRYGDQDVRAVLDRANAGRRVSDLLSGVADAPIAAGIDDVPGIESGEIDALIVGVAPIGGGFDESWRPDIYGALQRGCDVIAGLHYFLEDDAEFAALAAEHDADLHDVRRSHEDLTVSRGLAGEVDAEVVLTVGTDCSVGKMTVAYELTAAAERNGIDAVVIPTGQTALLIEGWGNPIDRVVSDFAAGAVEEMVLEVGNDHDLLVVEGQGSIVHPAYSAVTCAILHGAMADELILCHAAGREAIHGYEATLVPSIRTYVDLYEDLAAPVCEAEVVAGALNTSHLDDPAATAAVEDYAAALDAPATDPIRFGAEELLEAIR